MEILYVLVGLAVLVGLYAAFTYNGLVALRTRAQEAWSDIQVQMKRRYDLIPNLVETVTGYAGHERGTLEAVIQARNQAAANTGTPEQQARSEGVLQSALKSLFALAEAYPELKANENFLALQTELADTEDRINMSRRFYNGSVRDLNIKVEQFPSNVVAGPLGFSKMQFFELDETEAAAASKPVPVSFGR